MGDSGRHSIPMGLIIKFTNFLPRWCNGSHDGLRSHCRKACEFESRPGHQVYSEMDELA